jgi:hypothetical protein
LKQPGGKTTMKILWVLLTTLVSTALLAQTPPASFVTAKLFEAATPGPYGDGSAQPYGIAAGDFNNDGKLDIVAAGWGGEVTLNLGNGDGTFQSLSQVYPLGGAKAVAVGDFNRDGNLDVAVLAAGQPGSVAIYLGDGTGNLNGPTLYQVGDQGPGVYSNIAAGHFRSASKLDLVVTNGYDNTVSVLLGNGDGTFQSQVPYSTGTNSDPQWVAVADFNKDGHPDLVTADSGQGIGVMLGNGDGTFQTPVFYSDVNGQAANGVAVADLNGDGNVDVVTAAWPSGVNVFLGKGDGTFQAAVSYSAPYATTVAISLAEVGGTLKPVLIVADFVESTAFVLIGNGDGTFNPAVPYATDQGAQGLAVADFNKDGLLDFAVGSNSGPFMTVALGNGDGTYRASRDYSFVEGWGANQIAAADLRLDGNIDIVEADVPSRQLHVMLGSPHGVLGAPSSISICGVPYWVAVGDVNGDSIPDVITTGGANSGCGVPNNSVAVLLGIGNGTFQTPVYYSVGNNNANNGNGATLALAALTSNGKLDIIVSNNDGSLSVLLNQGTGTFGAATVISGVTATAEYIRLGDFNMDGKLDLALPDSPNNTVKILLGQGNGTFGTPTSLQNVPQTPAGLTVGDFNKDGKLDLAVDSTNINNGGGAAIFLGNGDGTFTFSASYGWDPGSLGLGAPGTSPGALVTADVNGDGNLDLLIPLGQTLDWTTCNCGEEAGNLGMIVLLGKGDGTFVNDTAGPFLVGWDSLQVVVADFNRDGAIDAAVLEASGKGTYGAASFVTMLINNAQPVSASPLTVLFAKQTTGTVSGLQTEVLTNNQTTPLTISSVTLGGTDPADFLYKSYCPATLAPGAECTIFVAFKPTATGTRTATLSISDSVGTQKVTLFGTGN